MQRRQRFSILAIAALSAWGFAIGTEGRAQDNKTPPTESRDPYFVPTTDKATDSPKQPEPTGVVDTQSRAGRLTPPSLASKPQTPPSKSSSATANQPIRFALEPIPNSQATIDAPKRQGSTFKLPEIAPALPAADLAKSVPSETSAVHSSTLPSASPVAPTMNRAIAQVDENPTLDIKAAAQPSFEQQASHNESEVGSKVASAIAESPNEVFEAGRVLVIVGSRPILVGDLLQEINELIEKHAAKEPEARKQVQRQALVHRLLPKFIDRQLVYVDAVRGLPDGADMEQINTSLAKAFDEEALPKMLEAAQCTSSLQFDAQLRALGSSLRQYKQSWMDDQFVRYSLSQKMKGDDEVSYQEMKTYYDGHAAEYAFPAKARWEQLLIRFDRVPDRETARRMIAELGNEVVFGAPLDAVAKRSSHDFKASEGGMQGWTTQGSLASKVLDKAIFELPLNELSEVLESPIGYHIVRVLERSPAGTKPFREAQVEIKEKLLQEKQDKRFAEYLTKLRSEIPIEVVDPSVQLPDQYSVRSGGTPDDQ